MNKKKSILESNVLYTIIAIIAGFLIGAIFLMIAGISPAVAYGKLFSSRINKNMDNDIFRVLRSGLSTQHPKTTCNTQNYPLKR